MKILISSNSYWNLYNFRKSLIDELISKNYKIVLVSPLDEYKKKFFDSKCKLIDINFKPNKISFFTDFILIFKFIYILFKERPEFIITYTVKPNIYLSLANFFYNVKIINNITGLGSGFIKKNIIKKILIFLYRIAFIKSFRIYFHNSFDLNFFLDLKITNSKNSFSLDGSGVNLNKFKYSKIINKSNHNNYNFLYFGRMLKEKGVMDLIKAATEVKKNYKNVNFYLVGSCDINNNDSLKIKILENLSKNKIINYIKHSSNIIEYINSSDCVILPSYREGFPKSLIEACAVGRPIIASNIPGCNDIVTDEFNGFLFNVGDVNNLIETIIKFIKLDFVDKNKMSVNSKNYAIDKFDEKIIISKYIDAINN